MFVLLVRAVAVGRLASWFCRGERRGVRAKIREAASAGTHITNAVQDISRTAVSIGFSFYSSIYSRSHDQSTIYLNSHKGAKYTKTRMIPEIRPSGGRPKTMRAHTNMIFKKTTVPVRENVKA